MSETKFKSWYIDDIKKEDRKSFIIDCLKDYIKKAEEIAPEDSPYSEHKDIRMIMGFYKAIIEELGGKVENEEGHE